MKWKVGQELVKVDVTEPEGNIEWNTYRIRTIRGGKVYATMIASWTWGKKSSKHGDYGWLDPVDPVWRKMWLYDNGPSPHTGLATTKLKAVELAISSQKGFGEDEYYEGITNIEIVNKLERMLKTIRTKRKRTA